MDSLCHAALYLESQDAFNSREGECTSDSVAPSDLLDRPLAQTPVSVADSDIPSRSSPTCEACLFCGTVLQASDTKKRCKTQASIREFVTEHCRPTPFMYQVFANLKGDQRVPLCIACVNWQRRCSKGQRKRCNGRKPMLLMDHFVMFMLEPGKTIVPDQRCGLRLVKALLAGLDSGSESPANPLTMMPVQVQTMVASLPRDISGETLLTHLVRAWWEFNGRSVFFAHNLTAKLVRKMIKVL
jgi:hypothetical protein